MTERSLVLMIPVDEYAFEQAKEREFYACPADYGRNRGDYIAFYRTSPISKVTHYARINEIVEGDDEILTSRDKLKMFPSMSTEATVFKLGEVKRLKNPIENDLNGVQGSWYVNLQKLRSARKLSDLKKH